MSNKAISPPPDFDLNGQPLPATRKTPYIRVGSDYFKKINQTDRYNKVRVVLKKWQKAEIIEDHGKPYISKIPKYDSFCLVPDNLDYREVVNNCFNQYHPFTHKENPGEIKWSNILMEHVFGDQVALGYRYLQCLYLHPHRMLPILVLVSKERQTGKTTFLNWLHSIFGNNMVSINTSDFTGDFNAFYATANLIAMEETLIEKSLTVEKLKAMATQKFIPVNQKFVTQYELPFFGKIILTSNNEDRFAKVDEEEIRFFVRKLPKPKYENHHIEDDLIKEIPAFIHYLHSLPPVDFSVGRVPFTREELKNDSLVAVQKESKSSLYKDLVEHFEDQFENMAPGSYQIHANPVDIKNKWYAFNSRIEASYIRTVLKNDFNLVPCGHMRYIPFEDPSLATKTGTPYLFTPGMFGIAG